MGVVVAHHKRQFGSAADTVMNLTPVWTSSRPWRAAGSLASATQRCGHCRAGAGWHFCQHHDNLFHGPTLHVHHLALELVKRLRHRHGGRRLGFSGRLEGREARVPSRRGSTSRAGRTSATGAPGSPRHRQPAAPAALLASALNLAGGLRCAVEPLRREEKEEADGAAASEKKKERENGWPSPFLL